MLMLDRLNMALQRAAVVMVVTGVVVPDVDKREADQRYPAMILVMSCWLKGTSTGESRA